MLRLAFLGQRVYFGYTAMQEPADGVEPVFVDLRTEMTAAEVRAALHAAQPDVVVAFRPEYVPHGTFDGLDAVTVGYLTEPLPRPGRPSHPDLERRLGFLGEADAAQFDRVCSYDPYIAASADAITKIWRSFPIPVKDEHFCDEIGKADGRPRLLFTGRATEHRDAFLDPVKHDFDVVHLAHGVTDDDLEPFLERTDIGVNLHNEPYPNYENRVSVFLAAGVLTISETLSPRWGLEPGVDYVEIAEPWELWEVVTQIARTPDAFRAVRRSGRRKAERFRASKVWPALAREALADVNAFGSDRRR